MTASQFLLSFISPQRLEIVHSKINGTITVDTFFGHKRILVGGLTQSGEYVADLLSRGLNLAKKRLKNSQKILLLGLGGGSVVAAINRAFPDADIIGVEVDPQMITLGKKYFGLAAKRNLHIVNADAMNYCTAKKNQLFDIIISDVYIGYESPKKLESAKFLQALLHLLTNDGILICNRLYFGRYREMSETFVTALKGVFPHVETKKMLSNLLILATKN